MMTFKGVTIKTHRECAGEGCMRPVLPPKRKCMRCLKVKGPKQTLRASNKGRNARGIALHRPDRIRTRKAKRQNSVGLGMQPRPVTAYRAKGI